MFTPGMKSVFFLVGLALVASAALPSSPLPARSEFRFRYEGSVLSGLPIASDASLTRILSDVIIQTPHDKSAILRLDTIRIASSPSAQPETPFESLEQRQLNKEHEQLLRLPVQFAYQNGEVSELQFSEVEQAWSANIKRAVINMVQMKLNKDDKEQNALLGDNDYFTTVEKTIEGDCEVAYTVVSQNEKTRLVTKSVNFDKCTSRAEITYGMRFTQECPDCEKPRVLVPRTVYTYTIERNQLSNVEVRSTYTDMLKDTAAMQTEVRATLKLVEKVEIRRAIEAPRGDKQELIYSPEWERKVELFFKNGDESAEKTPFAEYKQKIEIVEKIAREMSKLKENNPESVHLMARLVEVLRMSTMEELQKIHEKVCLKSENKEQSIIEHALAIAGTKNTIEHLLRHVEKKDISPVKAVVLLKSIQETPYPSERIAEILAEFAKSELCLRHPALRQSAWLAFGSVVRGVVAPTAETHLVKEDSLKIKNKFVHLMSKQWKNAGTTYEKILALKTFANAAVDVSISEIERVIFDQKEHTSVRIEAIDALRMLCQQMPRKVQRLLMPIYSSRSETPELRMSALVMILHSQPAQPLLAQIVVRMEREPQQQVAAFTFRSLNWLAQSTSPCLHRVSSDLSALMRQSRFRPEQRHLSAFFHLPMYKDEHAHSGFNVELGSVFGKNLLPKELSASLDTLFAGHWNKYMAQIGVSQQNIEQIINKVINKMNKMEKTSEVRGRRVQQSVNLLKELARKMNIRARATSNQEPHAMLYLRYKQMDYAVLPIDEKIIDQLIEKYLDNGKIDQKTIERALNFEPKFDFTQAAYFFEVTRKVPTTIGMTITLSAKLPTIFTAQGEFTLEKVPFGVRARLNAQPSAATTFIRSMRLWTPIFEQGVKMIRTIESATPIDWTVEVVMKNELEVVVRAELPEREQTLLRHESRPVSYICFPEHKNLYKYVEAEEKTIVLRNWEQLSSEVEKKFEIAGVKATLRGNFYHQWTLENFLFAEQQMEITIAPLSRSEKTISARLLVESIKEGRIEKPQVEKMLEAKWETAERREDSERREHINKMVREMSSEGYTHRISLTIETPEKKSEFEFETECENKMRFCRVAANIRHPESRGEWKLKSSAEILMPSTVSSIEQLRNQPLREIHLFTESKWGSSEKNELKMNVQLKQNEEQREWLRVSEKELQGVPAYDLLLKAARLNQLKAVAEYNMSPRAEQYFARLYDIVKYYSFWTTELEQIESESGRVWVQMDVEPASSRLSNLTIQTPQERMEVRQMDLPVYLPTIARQSSSLIKDSVYEKAECEIKSDKVRSFDDAVFHAPLTTCYSVVAKDCSKEPRFAVLVKKTGKNTDAKKIKIISNEVVYEIEKVKGEFKITVDEKIVRSESELEQYNIEKLTEKLYQITLEDVIIRFDGYTVKVQLSNNQMEKQCGLCGHFDGEEKNELRTANDEETEDIEEFHRSFIVKHEECEMEEEKLSDKKNYKMYETENSSEEESYDEKEQLPKWRSQKNKKVSEKTDKKDNYDQYEESSEQSNDNSEPIEKTRVIEFSHRICFSLEAIPECPKNMQTGRATEKKVRFTCLPRHAPETRRMTLEARRSPLSLPKMPVSIVENILVPQACEVY